MPRTRIGTSSIHVRVLVADLAIVYKASALSASDLIARMTEGFQKLFLMIRDPFRRRNGGDQIRSRICCQYQRRDDKIVTEVKSLIDIKDQ